MQPTESGQYKASWRSEHGRIEGEVAVMFNCPAHKRFYEYCVMLGAICYPPKDFKIHDRS